MKIALFLLPFFFFSCGHLKKPEVTNIKKKKIEKKLSPEEKRRLEVLNYYRLLRLKDREKKKLHKSKYIPIKRKEKVIPQKTMKSSPQKTKRKITVNFKDQEVEIEQRLIYFCMEKRKSSRFNKKESCEQFTKNLEMRCQRVFEKGESRLTRCIKSGLR